MVIKYIPFQGNGSPTQTNAGRRAAEQARADLAELNRSVVSFGILNMNDLFQSALDSVQEDTYRALRMFVDATGAAVRNSRRTRITQIHAEAAEDALQYMYERFRTRGSRDYRSNLPDFHGRTQRDSGGKLRNALASHNMYRASQDGLDFINPVWLDSQARQWYRINFGAGARGSQTPAAKPAIMEIYGQKLPGDFGLTGFRPSASYFLPPGYWLDASNTVVPWGSRSSKDAFMPSYNGVKHLPRESRKWISRQHNVSLGFEGSRYLDEGVDRLVRILPIQYAKLFNEWFIEFEKNASGPFASQTVTNTKKNKARIAAEGRRILTDAARVQQYMNGRSRFDSSIPFQLKQFYNEEPF